MLKYDNGKFALDADNHQFIIRRRTVRKGVVEYAPECYFITLESAIEHIGIVELRKSIAKMDCELTTESLNLAVERSVAALSGFFHTKGCK